MSVKLGNPTESRQHPFKIIGEGIVRIIDNVRQVGCLGSRSRLPMCPQTTRE